MSDTFDFEGDAVAFDAGDTLAAALLRYGVLTFSRSAKYHRPRGPFCLAGTCGQCHMRVDGEPDVPTCVTPAHAGARVERQNVVGSADHDLLRAVDFVFPEGLDHHHLMTRFKTLNHATQAIARRLAGIGELPDSPLPVRPAVQREADVVVIGQGRSGRAAAEAARATGARVITLEQTLANNATPARAVGLYAEGGRNWVLAKGAHETWQIATRSVVLATGGIERPLTFEGNDLPGVFGARGLLRLVRRQGVRPGKHVVLVGSAADETLAREFRDAGFERVHLVRNPVRALGSKHVTGLVGRQSDGRVVELGCDLILVAEPLQPAWELAGQVGARVEHRAANGGFVLVTDTSGRTSVPWLFGVGRIAPNASPLDAGRLAAD